jgi:hypothetical protein
VPYYRLNMRRKRFPAHREDTVQLTKQIPHKDYYGFFSDCL